MPPRATLSPLLTSLVVAAEERRRTLAIESTRKRLGCGIEDFLAPRRQLKHFVDGVWIPKEPATWPRKLIKSLHNLVWPNVKKTEVIDRLAARVQRRIKEEGTVGGNMAVRMRKVYEVKDTFVSIGRKM